MVTGPASAGWLVGAALLILSMQLGLVLYEVGSVRAKNAQATLLKALVTVVAATIAWFTTGYALAFGTGGNSVAGGLFQGANAGGLVMSGVAHADFPRALWGWAACLVGASVAARASAERMHPVAHAALALTMGGMVLPLTMRWVWHGDGWLRAGAEGSRAVERWWAPWLDFRDYSGGAALHVAAGVVGLVAAVLVGARSGRFNDEAALGGERQVAYMPPHNMVLAVAGAVWVFGTSLGFAVSPRAPVSGNAKASEAVLGGATTAVAEAVAGGDVASAMVAMGVAGASGAATAGIVALRGGICGLLPRCCTGSSTSSSLRRSRFAAYGGLLLPATLRGMLAGFAAIAASADVVTPAAAAAIGAAGALAAGATASALLARRIDDPLDAFAAHGCGGALGVIARALFSDDTKTSIAQRLLGQFVGLVAITAWAAAAAMLVLVATRMLLARQVRCCVYICHCTHLVLVLTLCSFLIALVPHAMGLRHARSWRAIRARSARGSNAAAVHREARSEGVRAAVLR